jgi:radical SAM family uncharacterized protein
MLNNLDAILYGVTKPARYTGNEWDSVVKDWDATPIRIALSYPDLYEIGMSTLGLSIIYDLLNRQPDALAERVYAPWRDMAAALRSKGIPLFSLETKRPLKDFDVIGFSLGYELTYTNVLEMLDLAQIPVLAAERNDSHPLIITGGCCALNPEPMADFIDLFVIGEGEEVVLELLEVLRKWQRQDKKATKRELLRRAASIRGIYVPGFYQVAYDADGLPQSITPIVAEARPIIERRIVTRLPPPVTKPVVPYIEVVHDRGAVEIQRGCSRGCRFCQAGMIYRPVRERPQAEVLQAVAEIISNCGYNEVSLVSLSTGDYPDIEGLVARLFDRHPNLTLSLPSLRIDSFSPRLLDLISSHKRTGLTFAPEAGSERLRCAINKSLAEEELLNVAALAFERGWTTLKLYFMLGLPTETTEDVEEIARLVEKVYALGKKAPGRRPQMRVTVSTFIPKPHTPFQWVAQEGEASLSAKQELLTSRLRQKGIKLSWSDPKVSLLEAAMSRGDRRLGRVIYRAWQMGSTFDAWSEQFNYENWRCAFEETGLKPEFYAQRERPLDEFLPWSHIDIGVTASFLKREYQRAAASKETRDCRYETCHACGLERWQPDCQQRLKSSAKPT